MQSVRNGISSIRRVWRGLVTIGAPLILTPFLYYGYDSSESRCGYVVLLMAIYWATDAIPLCITALLPVVLFPLLGLATTEQACAPYLQPNNMLFLASLIIAIAVESSNLHKRIAYKALMIVGTDIRYLIGGFMMTTMFMGIWIINTAATAMMLPIADVIVEELLGGGESDSLEDEVPLNISSSTSKNSCEDSIAKDEEDGVIDSNNHTSVQIINPSKTKDSKSTDTTRKLNSKKNERLRVILYLSIAFSATIGGTSTLTSNGPNLVLRFVLDDIYHGLPPVDYTKWLLFCLPATLTTVAILWFIYKKLFMSDEDISSYTKSPRLIIAKKYQELGAFTFHEVSVCILFVLLILLWMFRDPQFMPGWATFVGGSIKPKDATAAMLIVVLLFMIPAHPTGPFPSESLLSWPMVQSRLAWGVLLLRGGGFAMADTASRSGLALLMAQQLKLLSVLSLPGLVITFSLMACVITELASNSAVATILLPIAGQLASSLDVNPLMLLVPITLSCSYAFVLPVGTPANALVCSHARINQNDMFIPGIIAKSLAIIIMLINVYLSGIYTFDLNTFPDWAKNAHPVNHSIG